MFSEYRLKMLNKRAAKNCEGILSNIQMNKGCIIADIGAGGGYYSLKLSKITGNQGRVYAVDNNINSNKYIEKICAANNISNIKTCGIDKSSLPIINEKLDLVFMRDVFHHLEQPEKYFSNLKKLLKPDGEIIIIDYLPNTPGMLITKTKHCTPKEKILKIMKGSGYSQVRDIESLYGFSFTIWKL